MRMRELEQLSGVGRETIRYYIREGLLPEPDRASRNSASYSDEHVARLRAIKRLQDERYLPLAVIKDLLDAEGGDRWLEPQAFPQLDAILHARLDANAADVPLDVVLERVGMPREEVPELVELGVIDVAADGSVTARDAAILRALGDLRACGIADAEGKELGGIGIYVDFIEWLTSQELRMFFEGTAGRVQEAEAADMAVRAIAAINDLISLMRTRALLKKLGARHRIANDNVRTAD